MFIFVQFLESLWVFLELHWSRVLEVVYFLVTGEFLFSDSAVLFMQIDRLSNANEHEKPPFIEFMGSLFV